MVETYGIARDGRPDAHMIEVEQPGGIYAGDEYVYWGFGAGGLGALARLAGRARGASMAPSSWMGTRASWRR